MSAIGAGQRMTDWFGSMHKAGPGACYTDEFNDARWVVTRGLGSAWYLLFHKRSGDPQSVDEWHEFGKFATLTAAVAAYEAMEV